MVGWKCSLPHSDEPLTPPQGSGCHTTFMDPHLKSTLRNTSGQEQMSVKEAEELKVWFFRVIGLSKSHHSCEEIKQNQGFIVHWWLIACLAGWVQGWDWLTCCSPCQLPSWHQGLDKWTVRRHTVGLKWKRGSYLCCRHSASEYPPYAFLSEQKDRPLWDFQRTGVGQDS